MNKPPEKIRVVVSKNGKAILDDCDQWSIAKWGRNRPEEAPFTEHFYTLEKPMTQKTENLTTEEAWTAMARGECVKSCSGTIRRINRIAIEYYEEVDAQWLGCDSIGKAPYFIVPDPSKPKEVDGEYEKDREYVIKDNGYHEDFIEFIEKYYVRKP